MGRKRGEGYESWLHIGANFSIFFTPQNQNNSKDTMLMDGVSNSFYIQLLG